MTASEWWFDGEVTRVVDGDTIDVKLDLGFRIHFDTRVRLLWIDTPERGQDGYEEARDAVHAWLKPYDYQVLVMTTKPDKYGRALATVRDRFGKRDLVEYLLSEGHGVAYPKEAQSD